MQEWLCQALEACGGLSELIVNIDYIESFDVLGLEEERVLKSYKNCIYALHINEIISVNKNISLNKSDSLKPDILMYAPEAEGMVIIELKNLSGPSQEAGTMRKHKRVILQRPPSHEKNITTTK